MENENKGEEPSDMRHKRLRRILRFVLLFLLVVSLVWVALTIAVWISFGPTTSADPEKLQAFSTFMQDVLKPLEEKYGFEWPMYIFLTDDDVMELGLKTTEPDRMIELMREIHALKTCSPTIDKNAVDVKISCVSPRQGQSLRFQTAFLNIRTVMPGESGYTGDPARSTDVRIWNETGEKFFPHDKLFAPDGASDEIEAFIQSILKEPGSVRPSSKQ